MQQEITRQRKFYSLDQERVRAQVVRMGKVVDKLLPDIVASALDLSLKLRGITAVHPEKKEQLAAQLAGHYRLLLAGDRSAELEESYHTVASTIGAIGEDTRLSISIGSVVMRSILRAGARRMIWCPFEFAKCGMAMGSLFSFDVSIALHLQIEQERAALRTRAGLIDSAIDGFREEVSEVIHALAMATDHLTTSCSRVDIATADTAQRSDSAVNSISESTAILKMSSHAVEELGASIRHIGDQAMHGANLAADAVRTADISGAAMHDLSSALGDIDTITHMIGTIAGQTNLLALNATIEAARAGEAGRGFAVVASEVKGLVAQVERATEEIKKILGKVRNASDSVTGEMHNIGNIIGGLSASTASVSIAVQQQRQAVEEICLHIDSVVKHNSRLESGIAALSDSSVVSAREAGSLQNLSAELRARSANIKRAFEQLAENLRAA